MSFVVPDACTLPTATQPGRLAEFDALFAAALRHVERLGATRVRMRLTGPAGLTAAVGDLTARETECCSFFTFTLTPERTLDGEALTLDIEVPSAYADVLSALVERALHQGEPPVARRDGRGRNGAVQKQAQGRAAG